MTGAERMSVILKFTFIIGFIDMQLTVNSVLKKIEQHVQHVQHDIVCDRKEPHVGVLYVEMTEEENPDYPGVVEEYSPLTLGLYKSVIMLFIVFISGLFYVEYIGTLKISIFLGYYCYFSCNFFIFY